MPKLTLYKQVRLDGGERTGLAIDNVLRLATFVSGSDDYDPALSWYLDVRCEGASVPSDPEEARAWLLNHAALFESGLHRLADELKAGVDAGIYPAQRLMEHPPEGAAVKFVCSAMRRLSGLEIAAHIEQTANEWSALVRGLGVAEAVGV
jgi:hypothetical protein